MTGIEVPVNSSLANKLNYSVGVASGLATICLLSLIPARRIMAELVSPETVLKRAASNVDQKTLAAEKPEYEPSNPKKIARIRPKQTPLLTIEQMLITANERRENYTVKQSIYYMHISIKNAIGSAEEDKNLVEKIPNWRSNHESKSTELEDFEYIFDHWEKCIEIGIQGEPRDLELLVSTQSEIISELMANDHEMAATERLDGLTLIIEEAFKRDIYRHEFITIYSDLIKDALDYDMLDLVVSLESSSFTLAQELASHSEDENIEYTEKIAGERRDILEKTISTNIEALGVISNHENTNTPDIRQIAGDIIEEMNMFFGLVFENIESEPTDNATGSALKQNLLSTLRRSLIETSEPLLQSDEIVGENILQGTIEIAIYQDMDESKYLATLTQEFSDESLIESHLLEAAEAMEDPDSMRMFDEIGSIEKGELRDFTSNLEKEYNPGEELTYTTSNASD